LGLLPAYFLLRFVAFYYLLFSARSTAALFDFFRRRIGTGRLRSLLKIYRNYYLFGQTLIDKIVLMSGIKNRFTFDFDGEDHLREMVALGKGGILLSAHLGNWEAAGMLLKRLGTRVHVVMFDGEHREIKEYLDSVLIERDMNIIVLRDDISHIYQISDALSNNEIVCMHADRFREGNRTLSAGFLGEQASFPLGPFLLATRFKVPVSFVFAVKEKPTHYHFFASKLRNYGEEKREGAVENHPE
jgi:predicted LPLAT superfamily acyltransferase